MAKFIYPTQEDLRMFISLLQSGDYAIKKYLPHTNEEWFKIIQDSIAYVRLASSYENHTSIQEACAHLVYKIVKKHEFGDGNKRSSVICAFLFCLLNDFAIVDPKELKAQAKRLASTKGRSNENLMCKRVAVKIEKILEKLGGQVI